MVFRPAYNREELSEILSANVPKATWKAASNDRFDASSHSLQKCKVVRLPYISPASSMSDDKVLSLISTYDCYFN